MDAMARDGVVRVISMAKSSSPRFDREAITPLRSMTAATLTPE